MGIFPIVERVLMKPTSIFALELSRCGALPKDHFGADRRLEDGCMSTAEMALYCPGPGAFAPDFFPGVSSVRFLIVKLGADRIREDDIFPIEIGLGW